MERPSLVTRIKERIAALRNPDKATKDRLVLVGITSFTSILMTVIAVNAPLMLGKKAASPKLGDRTPAAKSGKKAPGGHGATSEEHGDAHGGDSHAKSSHASESHESDSVGKEHSGDSATHTAGGQADSHAAAGTSGHEGAHESSHGAGSGTSHETGNGSGPTSLVVGALKSVQTKFDQIQRAEEENGRLRLESAHLRLKNEALQFDCHTKEATKSTRDYQAKINSETSTLVGRTLASINYRPPTHLPAIQLYTLGVAYFKAREDEKAAVIFSFLTSLDDQNGDVFKTARNYLMTGVAWYRLDNLRLADTYFELVLKSKESDEVLPALAQARLWRALVADRSGNRKKAQTWLTELIDHHPHSRESVWVNTREDSRREPAGD